ncbi:MAG: hypothetical protein GC154_21495 [bacterium]|nr:hypothetical protein [bacterium]
MFILIVFFAVTAALSAMYKNHFFDGVSESNDSEIQQEDAQAASATPVNATPAESMDYDEAKRLFGGEP